MKNVMKKAWKIAKKGAEKFGGKASEYIAESLRMAWAIVKNGVNKYVKQIKGTIEELKVKALKGTEKQIKWAEDIRKSAVDLLFEEVLHEEYIVEGSMPMKKSIVERCSVKNAVYALRSKESIKDFFEDKKDMPASRLDSDVKTLNDAYDRYQRFTEIMTNDSAKFWIDNRDNQPKNYMFKNFIEYIRTGVKNF